MARTRISLLAEYVVLCRALHDPIHPPTREDRLTIERRVLDVLITLGNLDG